MTDTIEQITDDLTEGGSGATAPPLHAFSWDDDLHHIPHSLSEHVDIPCALIQGSVDPLSHITASQRGREALHLEGTDDPILTIVDGAIPDGMPVLSRNVYPPRHPAYIESGNTARGRSLLTFDVEHSPWPTIQVPNSRVYRTADPDYEGNSWTLVLCAPHVLYLLAPQGVGFLTEGTESWLRAAADLALSADLPSIHRDQLGERAARFWQDRFTNNQNATQDNLRQQVTLLTTRIDESHRMLAQYETQKNQITASMDTLQRFEENPTLVVDNIAGLLDHPDITNVAVHTDALVVTTRDMDIYHPGRDEYANLGILEIRVRIVDDSPPHFGRITNLTNRRNGYDHPHVHGGSFCTGAVSTVNQLLTEWEIVPAIEFALGLLQTCNPDDDWGRSVRFWFSSQHD